MDKFTKIIATLGPVSDQIEIIEKLYKSGMNTARLNCSHSDHNYLKQLIDNIRKVSNEIAILLDLKGPEIRTGVVQNNQIELIAGEILTLTNEEVIGDYDKLTLNYDHLEKVEEGTYILIDDGLIETQVISKTKNELKVKVLNSGILGSRKTVSIPNHDIQIPFLSQKDIDDIEFGIKHNVDFIAASFVRKKEDINKIKDILNKHKSKIHIISKIEHFDAVKNMKDIIKLSDGIMVARGDLGVEISHHKVPKVQYDLINICNELGRPVIVATQMLESMKENPRPTRAEVSDVSYAVIQGADAIMLSAETASGKYPIQSVKMMSKIAKEYELHTKNKIEEKIKNDFYNKNAITLYVTKAAYMASIQLNTRAIITPTESGYTAKKVSRFRPKCEIIAITRDMTTFRQLQLSRGVFPYLYTKKHTNFDSYLKEIMLHLYNEKILSKNDTIVGTAGYNLHKKGTTNLIEIFKIKDLLSQK
jgi:pyruvate kinase